jgi:hypothetical protein
MLLKRLRASGERQRELGDSLKGVPAGGAVGGDADAVRRTLAFAPRVPVVLPVMPEIVMQQGMLALGIAVVREIGALARLVER